MIVAGSIAPGVSAREYSEASERTLRNPGLLRGEAGRVFRQLNPRDFGTSKRIELDGEDAYSLDYSGDQGGRVMRFRSVVTVRDGRAYAITYTALRHRFREHADEANRVIETWAWR